MLQRLAGTKELLEVTKLQNLHLLLGSIALTTLNRSQDFFGGEMRDGWRFLAMIYIPSLKGVQVGELQGRRDGGMCKSTEGTS